MARCALSSQQAPPLTSLQAWADALQLSGEARTTFYRLAIQDALGDEVLQTLLRSDLPRPAAPVVVSEDRRPYLPAAIVAAERHDAAEPGFGSRLHRHLQLPGLSQRAFAAQAGISQSQVQALCSGQRRPPLAKLQHWIEILALEQVEAAELRRAAELSHCPAAVRQELAHLQRRIEQLSEPE